MKIKKGTPIEIEWFETTISSEWEEDVEEEIPISTIKAIGYFVMQDKEKIAICNGISLIGSKEEERFGLIIIPLSNIKKISLQNRRV